MLKACDPDSDAEGPRIYLLCLIFHKQDAYATAQLTVHKQDAYATIVN